MHIIDSHIHFGIQKVFQPFEEIAPLLNEAGIAAACLFAPVEDIYYRHRPDFDDNERWRETRIKAHDYLLDLARAHGNIYPYYFVWNDFCVEDLDKGFRGVKWHHHIGEPEYRYNAPRCTEMIDAICERRLPIVLEETFTQTLGFLDRVAGRTPVIIPHLGLLNGGIERLMLANVWDAENVYTDSALADPFFLVAFLDRYGASRLLFGSDHPFGVPAEELAKITRLRPSEAELEMICSGNILKLLAQAPSTMKPE